LYVIVVGCGRAGAELAARLSKNGLEVVAIDKDETALDYISPEFTGFTITGDASDISVLEQAKIQDADALIVTTENDNVNSMIAQIGKSIYNVAEVKSRVNKPEKTIIYRDTGIDTFAPSSLLVSHFESSIMEIGEEQ
jgi:trk system potassium uptake protein TrkA